MTTSSILRGIIGRYEADAARVLTASERKAHLEATDAVHDARLALENYLDAGKLLRAASKGDPQALEALAIRMYDSNAFCEHMIACSADVPSVKNDITKPLLRIAIRRTNGEDARLPEPTSNLAIMRLSAGQPCRVKALTVGDKVKFVQALDETTEWDAELQCLVFGGFGRKVFDKRYDRQDTYFVINGKVFRTLANPYACPEHNTHRTGDPAGTMNWVMPHKVYDLKFNDLFERYLAEQDSSSPAGRTLDHLARLLIAGESITVISHEITGHAKVVANELAKRALVGVSRPKPTVRKVRKSHHNAPYTSYDFQDEHLGAEDTSMFAYPELDWNRWYWIPVGNDRHTIAYLLPERRMDITLPDGKPSWQYAPGTFMYKVGQDWQYTTLGNWHSSDGVRFLPKVFRHRLFEKTETVSVTGIDVETGELYSVQHEETRHFILRYDAAHPPYGHRTLETAFREGMHAYWLRCPSQAVISPEWYKKEQARAELERFKGLTARSAVTYQVTVPNLSPAIVNGQYVPLALRTEVDTPYIEHADTRPGLPSQAPTIGTGGTWIDGSTPGARGWLEDPRPRHRKALYHDDDDSIGVVGGQFDPHDESLRTWTMQEMTDATFAIEGGDASDTQNWMRDGDIDASLAAMLGRDAGAYIAGMWVRQTEDGETTPIVQRTHRNRYDANNDATLTRILGKTEEIRAQKEVSRQNAEITYLLEAFKAKRIDAAGMAAIAHARGFRDCKITSKDGTVSMLPAASQLLNRKPIIITLEGEPLDAAAQIELNGNRKYTEFPVIPNPHSTQDAHRPDYADRLVAHTDFWRFFFLCTKPVIKYAFDRLVEAAQAPRTPLTVAAVTAERATAHVRPHAHYDAFLRRQAALNDQVENIATCIEQAFPQRTQVNPLPPVRPGRTTYGMTSEPTPAASTTAERTWAELYAADHAAGNRLVPRTMIDAEVAEKVADRLALSKTRHN